MKQMRIYVSGMGHVDLEPTEDDIYQVFDQQGLWIGSINPLEIPDWTDDEYALSAVIEELIDQDVLDLPTEDRDYYEQE